MKNKKKVIILTVLIIIVMILFIFGYLIYHFYIEDRAENIISNKSPGTPNQARESACTGIEDNYIKPDFKKAETILSDEPIVKDVPKKGKIRVMFYHFVGDCRIWDKIYFLSDGTIEERSGDADIDIWISSDYVEKIQAGNFCEVITEARKNGDLGQKSNVGTTKLMWTYKSMLKYKDCLGLKI